SRSRTSELSIASASGRGEMWRRTVCAGEAAQPVAPCREDDVADAGDEGGPGGGVGVAKCSVAQECLDPAPLAAGGDARVELAARLTTGGPVGWLLAEDGSSAENRCAGPAALGGGIFFDSPDALEEHGGEGVGGQLFETRGTCERKRHGLGHRALFAEEVLGTVGNKCLTVKDGAERGDAGPMVRPLDQPVLDRIREG